MLRMTPEAVHHVLTLAGVRGVEPVLRVRVVAGGCRGLTWDAVLGAEETRAGDRRRSNQGVEVVVDRQSADYLRGGRLELVRNGASPLRTPLDGPDATAVLRLRGLPERRYCESCDSLSPDVARRR